MDLMKKFDYRVFWSCLIIVNLERFEEKGEYYENEIIFSIWPSGKVIKTEEDCKLLIGILQFELFALILGRYFVNNFQLYALIFSISLFIGSNTTIAAKKKCSFIPHGNYLQHTVVSDLLVYEKIIGLKTGVWPAVKDGIQ